MRFAGSDEPGQLELTVTLKKPALLVLAEGHDPGWSARVNQQPAELVAVNSVVLGLLPHLAQPANPKPQALSPGARSAAAPCTWSRWSSPNGCH